MDRARIEEFRDFALLLEGCLRGYAEKLALSPPRNPLGRAIYRALPAAQRLIGRDPQIGFMGLDPETCRAAIADGSVPPSVPDLAPAKVDLGAADAGGIFPFNGGISDSARILGRIEKAQRAEISEVYARWAAAERRRDTPEARTIFMDAVVRRIMALCEDPLPGARPPYLDADRWNFGIMEEPSSSCFALAAAEVFTAAGEAESPRYSAADRFDDRLLGARLCGHVEGFAHFPMKEIAARFTARPDDHRAHATISDEFGRAVAASALKHPNVWVASTDAIVPGLHEHLVSAKCPLADDPPPARM
jgi:hypothetical protein